MTEKGDIDIDGVVLAGGSGASEDNAPVSTDIVATNVNEASENTITLAYTDQDNDLATDCSVSNLTGLTETTACDCDVNGVCTVGVTASNSGAVSFEYQVTALSLVSNTATVTYHSIDVAPVSSNVSASNVLERNENTVTLSYTDAGGDLATSCTISNLSNVTVSTACACNGSGVCTVGVTGAQSFLGSVSFDYTVTADSATSNTSTVSFDVNQRPFTFVWRTTGANESMTLPLPAGTYSATVDWGDGSATSSVGSSGDPNATHVYTSPGDYTVSITGAMTGIQFYNTAVEDKLISVTELGGLGWTSLASAFRGCDNLTSVSGGNVSNVTNFTSMFMSTGAITLNLSSWDTSSATTMYGMFKGSDVVAINSGSWNVSNVTDFREMFSGAQNALPDTSGWDTGSATTMQSMFF